MEYNFDIETVPAPLIHIIGDDAEYLVNPDSIGRIIKLNEEGNTEILVFGQNNSLAFSLRDDVARAFWHSQLERSKTTIVGDIQTWMYDFHGFNYYNFHAAADLIMYIDSPNHLEQSKVYELDDYRIFAEWLEMYTNCDEQLMEEFFKHAKDIGRKGRAQLLKVIADAMVNLTDAEPTPTPQSLVNYR